MIKSLKLPVGQYQQDYREMRFFIRTLISLTETYSRVRVGKNVPDRFPIRNGLKQGDALTPMLFNFALEGPGKTGWLETKWYTSASGLCR